MSEDTKFTFAPEGYKPEWQHAPRWSRIPYGYYSRGFTPTWRIVERAIFWGIIAAAAIAIALV